MDNRYDGLLRELSEKAQRKQNTYPTRQGEIFVAERNAAGVKYISTIRAQRSPHLFTEGYGPANWYSIEIRNPEGETLEQRSIPAAHHPSLEAARLFEVFLTSRILEAKVICEGLGGKTAVPAFVIDDFLDNAGNRVDDYASHPPGLEEVSFGPEVAFLDYAKKSFRGMYGHHIPLHARPEFNVNPSAERVMSLLVGQWNSSRFKDSTSLEAEHLVGHSSSENQLNENFVVALAAFSSPEVVAEYPLRDVECLTVVLGSAQYNNPDYNTTQMFFDDPSKITTWFKAVIATAILEAQQCTSEVEAKQVIADLVDPNSKTDLEVYLPENMEPLPCDPSRVESDFSAWLPTIEDAFNQAHPHLNFNEVCPGFVEASTEFKI